MFLLIIKGIDGWRMDQAKSFDGVSYQLINGVFTSDAYLATLSNLRALVTGGEMVKTDDEFYLPMKPDDAIDFLEGHDYGVDDNMRIRPMLGDPFMRIRTGHIGPMIAVHLKGCQEQNKNPEVMGVTLVWHKMEDGKETLIQVYDPTHVIPLPCDMDNPGKFMYVSTPDKMHKMLALNFQDYYLIPKASNFLMMYKFLGGEDGPEDLSELTKQGQFVDKDGIIRKSGRTRLGAQSLSIEDFLK